MGAWRIPEDQCPAPSKRALDAHREMNADRFKVIQQYSRLKLHEEFLRQSKLCQRYGAAGVVMAFDEQGQAATDEDKTKLAELEASKVDTMATPWGRRATNR